MRNLCAIAVLTASLFAANVASADIQLYKGESMQSAGITLGSWGSGMAVEAGERAYMGTRAIKIISQGLHEGGSIQFKKPVELINSSVNDSDYLQFVVGLTVVKADVLRGNTPGLGTKSPAGSSYSPGGYSPQEFDVPTRPKVSTVRVVLESVDGKTTEATCGVPENDDQGWYKISIPFKALGLKAGDSFKLSKILMFTDIYDTMFVGEIGTIRDDSPIIINTAGDDQVIAAYDNVIFQAEADGGAATLHYSWNFGDQDPSGEDASGSLVSHQYKKGTGDGFYTVKLTVSDVWGVKKPVSTTLKIVVND